MNKKGFKPGESGNANGRPAGQGSKPISSLRRTLTQLRKLEAQALENIAAVINGKTIQNEDGSERDIDKLSLETSKWLIGQLSSLSRAATQEEALKMEVRREVEPKAQSQEVREGTTGNVVQMPSRPTFSTNIQKDGWEEEEEVE